MSISVHLYILPSALANLGHILVLAPLDRQQQLGEGLGKFQVAVVAQRPDQVLLVFTQLGERVALHDLLQLDVELLPPAPLEQGGEKEWREERKGWKGREGGMGGKEGWEGKREGWEGRESGRGEGAGERRGD